ncbi:M50 family metallopeptidase [Oxynema aestuarii]|jgi:hypothetical protein|uniref:M50 family metallopeptidase n=1 Tax=Oxynema aestuarii AP17 TaxID=2064643 RepID=A0A6H1TXN4_9CYAN|nr:M50 family metallopeptidase [Oxynema aestuarii]QIZ71331.1 M50 family metallopeptidase [Oxynema aestuarii AP17]RMH77073.1 MAG: M50 family peptidase [Cyanobacteria bacterium J007]
MSDSLSPSSSKIGLIWLVIAAAATVLLWQFPWGTYILYPFSILATWFHEMGHGLTAALLGGNFHQLALYRDGSGVAMTSVSFLGRLGQGFVAMGGPLGPAVAGGFFIISSRRFKTAHWCLMGLGCLMLISVLLWIRTLFGVVAIALWGLFILGISLKTPKSIQAFFLQFMGMQALVSTYHQKEYLFGSPSVNVNGSNLVSDTGIIAHYLFLPHWFWAAFILILSALIFGWSLRIAYGSTDESDRPV